MSDRFRKWRLHRERDNAVRLDADWQKKREGKLGYGDTRECATAMDWLQANNWLCPQCVADKSVMLDL